MMLARKSILQIVTLLLLSFSMLPVSAEEAFKPTPTLVIETRATLGIEPKNVTLSGDLVYVLGANAAGVSEIEVRDARSLELITSQTYEFEIEDIVADQTKSVVFAMGHRGDASRFQVLDTKLRTLGAVTIRPRIGHPSLTVNADNLVGVSGIRTDFSDGFFAAIDVSTLEEPILREDFYSSDARRGVMDGWMDARFGVLFLNAAWDSRLLAVATGKSYVMSEFGVRTSNSRFSEPYSIAAQFGQQACGNQSSPTSFLIADMSRNELSLLGFDETFQSLDLLSSVEFKLGAVKAVLNPLSGTQVGEPTGLIKASCDQSVILLGSKLSDEIAQFSRNKNLSSLERVGTIKLRDRPVDVAVDYMSGFAVVVSKERREITRLGMVTGGTTKGLIIGDANIRELQRTLTEIGIPVGSIDGIMGAKTLRAVDLAERRFGVEIDARRDILQSIETLKRVTPLK